MTIKGGYAGVTLQVDLTEKTLRKEVLDEAFLMNYLGGRGFTSRLQYDLIPARINPLGPENVIIVALGPLTGTLARSTGRFTIGSRSPLTGLLGDANSGGVWGAVLKRAGYDLLIIRGRSTKPVYLWIDQDHVELRDARHLWGLDTRETEKTLIQELGRGISVLSIGQAGENLVKFASVMVNLEHAAARTGIGAVFGSKNLKAIAVRGNQPVRIDDAATFNELDKELNEILITDKRSGEELPMFGTTALLDHHSALGCLNTRNYNGGIFEGKEKVDGDMLNATYLVRATGCYRCPCKCDRYSRIDDGEFAGTEVGGPEYSTLVAFSSGCGNDNLASVLKANELCNLYGLDTIDTGNIIAFSMELFDRGILTKAKTDGIDLTWGNYRSILELIEKIAFRQGFGDLLAEGIRPTAQEIGQNAERYAVHVKGLTPPGPDARPLKVYNFRYAVSPRGADHLRISAPGAYGLDRLPISEAAEKLRFWENIVTVPDLMGVCKFPYSYYAETVEKTLNKILNIVPGLYAAATGIKIDGEGLLKVAQRVNNLERAHNSRLGLTAADDQLPPRFTEDPMPSGPAKGAVHDILEPMKAAWYRVHGWDEKTGLPSHETLYAEGLGDIADDLVRHGILTTVNSE
jgi:aldehyde:ferredoxin oxidoreductase